MVYGKEKKVNILIFSLIFIMAMIVLFSCVLLEFWKMERKNITGCPDNEDLCPDECLTALECLHKIYTEKEPLNAYGVE